MSLGKLFNKKEDKQTTSSVYVTDPTIQMVNGPNEILNRFEEKLNKMSDTAMKISDMTVGVDDKVSLLVSSVKEQERINKVNKAKRWKSALKERKRY